VWPGGRVAAFHGPGRKDDDETMVKNLGDENGG
jgi:hypothetical protein